MKVIRWLDKHLEEVISVILLASMTFVVAYQIIMRLIGRPATWSEESARYMFAWLIYISSAYAVKKRSHIKVEILSLVLKKKGNLILDLVSDAAFLIFSLVIMRYGWPYVTKMAFIYQQKSPSLEINMAIPYFSFVIGFTFMAIRLVQDMVLRVKEYKVGDDEASAIEEKA